MIKARWAYTALFALAVPACATGAETVRPETAMSYPGGRAAQPNSWRQAEPQHSYVEHSGPRGQAAQPYAWLDSRPAYPVDQHRLAQDGMTYLGGRAAQGGSWIPQAKSSWTLAQNDVVKAQQ